MDKNPSTPKEEDMKKYLKNKIGCLMHAMACTRLDISFVMGQVDKFQSVFPTCDILIGQMLIAYLNIWKGHLNIKILMVDLVIIWN